MKTDIDVNTVNTDDYSLNGSKKVIVIDSVDAVKCRFFIHHDYINRFNSIDYLPSADE
jgi:hypothetical protein